MEGFAQALFTLTHNGKLYDEATELLNSSIGENEFYIWIDHPDGSQFVLPEGGKLGH